MKRSPIKRAVIRSLRPGDPIPEGTPRRYKSSHGYVRLRWLVGPQEYVETYEHRLVAGLPEADVHHRDSVKHNNDPANLAVLSKEDHAAHHALDVSVRSRRITEWEGYRSQGAFDKAQRRKARVAERQSFLARLAELHDSGHTTVQIAARVGVDPSNVSRGLRAAGRTPKPRHGISAGVSRAVRSTVQARAAMRCERCGDNLLWKAGHLHHRIPRGMGGSDDPRLAQPSNLLYVCSGCHGEIESHRADALESGWLVSQWSDPATTPVLVDHGSRWTYLTAEGTYADAPEPAMRR